MNAVAGITLDRTPTGKPLFAHIDLRKHADMIPILKNKGVEIEKTIKWTAKMKRALNEKEFTVLDINNFWGE